MVPPNHESDALQNEREEIMRIWKSRDFDISFDELIEQYASKELADDIRRSSEELDELAAKGIIAG